MRAWYHSEQGLTADLCLLLDRESTRLIIRESYSTTLSKVYPSWQSALDALKAIGSEWVNDLTGKKL